MARLATLKGSSWKRNPHPPTGRNPQAGLAPSHDAAANPGRKKPAPPTAKAPESEWAGIRARLKDGRCQPTAITREVTVTPAASTRARRLPPLPYHEASESPHPGLDLFSGRSGFWWGFTESTPRVRRQKGPYFFSSQELQNPFLN
ncbi:small integral membrane protein 27 isoform X1 [Tupaia chinensis]|uniref:small integral membrane protein 27 isoform X1 n=1 Tax=Tupaia chinensis TaxID=246437 RepID=UPI000FFBAE66|nr:small integral membrane protein 27 isoform X1 [Tupaia chinensis]